MYIEHITEKGKNHFILSYDPMEQLIALLIGLLQYAFRCENYYIDSNFLGGKDELTLQF